jgi:hypothetical protein
MFENYTQTLQDQIGQLGKLLGVQSGGTAPVSQAANQFDCVSGLDGAKAFLGKMLSGTKHIVWDNEKSTFYVLQKDANGTAQRVQICNFTVELEPTMEEKYVTKEDFNALLSRLDGLLNKEVNDA